MGKTFRHAKRGYEFGEKGKGKFKAYSKKFPGLVSPRVFYNKLDTKWPRSKQLSRKRRTTFK